MKRARITVTTHEWNELVAKYGLKEAVEDVYVNNDGTKVIEIMDAWKLGDIIYITYLDRRISKSKVGYMQVGCKNTTTTVHQLVAKAFIPNPNACDEVNHIDGDKSNNDVNNLEWTTHSQNMKDAWDNGQISRTYKKRHATYNKKYGTLTLANGEKQKMTFDEYIIWRMDHGYRVDNLIRMRNQKEV